MNSDLDLHFGELCSALTQPSPLTGSGHRAENMEWTQRCSSWRHRKWSPAMLRRGFLTLFAIHAYLSLTVDGTQKKTKPTGYVFDANRAKEKSKTKGNAVFKETAINYDLPSRRVCAIMSSARFIWNQPVFRSVVMWFVFSGKIMPFLWLAKIFH